MHVAIAGVWSILVMAGAALPFGGELFPYAHYEAGATPDSVAFGDMDGDGDADLVVANRGGGTVSVLKSSGHGTFARRHNYAGGDGASGVTLVDVDSDGDLDVLVINRTEGAISLLRNVGDGVLAPRSSIGAGGDPRDVATGDIDGDGDPDIVVANGVPGGARVLVNDGAGSFSGGAIFAVSNTPTCIALGDLDGDGDLDMIVASSTALPNTASIFRNNGTGTFGAPASEAISLSPLDITLADMDGDGDLDLLVCPAQTSPQGSQVTLQRNEGDGTFGSITYLSIRGAFAGVADLDSDGDLDIASPGSSGVTIGLNDGSGAFPNPVTYAPAKLGGVVHRTVAAGDVDGDGDLDLAVESPQQNSVAVMVNRGKGRFDAWSNLALDQGDRSPATDVRTGDLDGDGDLDVVAGVRRVQVALNDGHGQLELAGAYKAFAPYWGDVSSVSLGDIDQDGDLDIAAGESLYDAVFLLRNDGNGQFAAPEVYSTPEYPSSVDLGDLDGDGDLDLVVVCPDASAPDGSIMIFTNNGAGAFSNTATLVGGVAPLDAALSDMNGDTRLDIVVSDSSGNTILVFINDGSGGFGASPVGVSVGGPRSLATRDLDGDGDLDVAVVTTLGPRVEVLLNDGTGQLNEPVSYATGPGPGAVEIGLVDGDDAPDLMVANVQGNTVSLLINRGDGRFKQRTDFALDTDAPNRVALADLDSDGDPDVVATCTQRALVTTVLNRRIQRPSHFCPADVDGDGYVSASDFSILAAHFGESVSPGAHGDLNADGVVDIRDFLAFAAGFGCGP